MSKPFSSVGNATRTVQTWMSNEAHNHPDEKLTKVRKEFLDGVDKMHLSKGAESNVKKAINELLPANSGNLTLRDALEP